jgi:hypothetical protein
MSYKLFQLFTLACALLVLAVPQAWAGDNTGQAGLLHGNAGANGGTVTVTVTADDGTVKTFKVDVAPGEASSNVLNDLSTKINADPDLTGGTGTYTIGGLVEPAETIDNLKVRSINGGFQIKSVKIAPDNSGFQNYESNAGATVPNQHVYTILPSGALPQSGMVDIQALITSVSTGAITTDITDAFTNGTSVDAMIATMSADLTHAGISNSFNGNALTLTTDASQDLFISLYGVGGLSDTAYEQTLESTAIPEPGTIPAFSLSGMALVGIGRWRRRRLLPATH